MTIDELERLFNNPDGKIRSRAARERYKLDILINDSDPMVRWEVAYNAYGLDVLVHDPDMHVRALVAEMGYGFDILVHDSEVDVIVQLIYAHVKNSKISVLLKHPDPEVRFTLAEVGLFLDILKDDEDVRVRLEAVRIAEKIRRGLKDVDVSQLSSLIEKTVDGRVVIISKAEVEDILLQSGYNPESADVDAMINTIYDQLADHLHEGVVSLAIEADLEEITNKPE